MTITNFNHSLRDQLTDELHSRPFLSIDAGSRISYFAVTHDVDGDPSAPFDAMLDLCRHLGIEPPDSMVSYFVRETNFGTFKWERHTEFATFMFVDKEPDGERFDAHLIDGIPQDWFIDNSTKVLVSAILAVEERLEGISHATVEGYRENFMPESFAVASVLENAAYIMSDFRADDAGHIRFVILPAKGTGTKRIGRIVQRVIEIETYMTATLLALPDARMVARKVPALGQALPPLLAKMHEGEDGVLDAFGELLAISSRTEAMIANTDYRFSAAQAYSSIVEQRLGVLREQRVAGFQMMSEFLLRRFDPSVRTIKSSRQQLQDFSDRVERASNLMRTQIDVNDANAQQELLAAMNKRGETQLRLQETVEGFSVVAISYYAVSLLSYIGAPIAKGLGIDKPLMLALAVPPTVLLVWYFINRIKKRVAGH